MMTTEASTAQRVRLPGLLRWTAAILVLSLFVACGGDDDGTGPDTDSLVGVWTAVEWTVTNVANPSQTRKLIEEGVELTLRIEEGGRATLTTTVAGTENRVTGTARTSGDTLTLDPDEPGEEPDVFTFRLSGDTLILDGEIDFDFNFDGTPELAETHIVLVR